MRFKSTAWIRNPQGGREDSPDGRFILWGDTLDYHFYDNFDLVSYGPFRTLGGVRRKVIEILSQDHKRPLTRDQQQDVLQFLARYG